MAHLTGVFQRCSAFYLRIVLPKGHSLSALYRNGRFGFVKSLGVCSHREALQRGLAKRAEVLCGFMPKVQLPELAPVAHTPGGPLAIGFLRAKRKSTLFWRLWHWLNVLLKRDNTRLNSAIGALPCWLDEPLTQFGFFDCAPESYGSSEPANIPTC